MVPLLGLLSVTSVLLQFLFIKLTLQVEHSGEVPLPPLSLEQRGDAQVAFFISNHD